MSSPQDAAVALVSGGNAKPGHYAGKMMGGFRLLREIGSGGMASVYLGYKAGPGKFGQFAAVKVVHPLFEKDREFVEMFLDEARIAATINHPNVARVLDFGRSEGAYYLAFEHLMGETWGQVRERVITRAKKSELERLPLMVAHVVERACEGLHAAHEATDPAGHSLQIVHRDVSPENLFVTYDGTVRVLDFGVASAIERLHKTRSGAVKGRYSYMAPEQMHGQKLDRRSDVWSLGVILWEGLARQPLFQKESEPETILAVTQEHLPPFPQTVSPVPEGLLKIALRALEREPRKRFKSAREMGVELSRFVSQMTPAPEVEVSSRMAHLFREEIEAKECLLAEAAKNAAQDGQEVILPKDDLEDETVETKTLDEPLPPTAPTFPRETPVEVAKGPNPGARHAQMVPFIGGAMLALTILLYAVSRSAPEPPARHTQAPRNGTEQLTKELALTAAPTGGANAVGARQGLAEPHRADPHEAAEPASARVAQGTPETTAQPLLAEPQDARTLRFGVLSVAAPGCWANVYDGTRKLGTAPGSFRLSAGDHLIRIEVGGRRPGVVRPVTIEGGALTRLRVVCP